MKLTNEDIAAIWKPSMSVPEFARAVESEVADRCFQVLSLLKVAILTGHPEYDERDWIDMIDTAMKEVRRD